MAVFLFTDRRLKRHRLLRDLDNLTHLVRRDLHPLADLLARRLPAILLHQPAAHAHQFVDRLHHMHGNADRARLVRNSARYGLPDPPCRVRAELVAPTIVELLHGADQAYIAFLDQVQQRHAPADVLLRHADDEPQVRLGELLLPEVALFFRLFKVITEVLVLGSQSARLIPRRRQQLVFTADRFGRVPQQIRR